MRSRTSADPVRQGLSQSDASPVALQWLVCFAAQMAMTGSAPGQPATPTSAWCKWMRLGERARHLLHHLCQLRQQLLMDQLEPLNPALCVVKAFEGSVRG